MKRSQQGGKLAGYSLAAGSLLVAGNAAHGAIIHIDLNPDVVLTGTQATNVNINGQTKFMIGHSTASGWSSGGISNRTSQAFWVGNSNPNSGVRPLNAGASIKLQTDWGQASSNRCNLASYSSVSSNGGYFRGSSGKYIGIKFQNGSNTNYGWIQVNIPANADKITITGYAYNDTPDGAITAGQVPELTGLGLLACGAAGITALRRTRAA